ncbi:HAD family hydrolase [Candidatus Reidiella endopervernicosa]|uniref:HAD family hydrolase n=1 Tax=Candidatus Reidiella endopervernicosa TaxID=2738883 RepID=UPI001EEF8950|nr:HAD-IA family hydrolase [Candidatus Reidiella endopervernicosa]
MNQIKTVLFDLDGTLLDTAPDLAFALNETLKAAGHAPLPYETIRPVVSHGGAALIELGFEIDASHPDFENHRQYLLDTYRDNIALHTRPFEGIETLLETIERRGCNWGVVTNKPAWLTDPLLKQLDLYERAATVISGDTLDQRKPHPAPMLHACSEAGSGAEACLYIGDAERDIEAGRNAGMQTLVALFGYIGNEETPERWGADGMINDPLEAVAWF